MTTERTPDAAGDLPNVGEPARRALTAAGWLRLEQFTRLTEAEVLALHGVGPKAVGRIRDALAATGRAFEHAGDRPG